MKTGQVRRFVWLGTVLLLVPNSTFAQRARSPADAAVFIRIVGSVHAEIEEFGVKRSVDLDRVEIGTGSGFVISPYGYVITNDHVVNETETLLITQIKGLQEAKITFKTSRIDVCFQPDAAAAHGFTSACSAASVAASDPALDLAALFISGSNLPYIALGDSDVVTTGLQVDALGYPLGREVEVGKSTSVSDLVPNVSATPGAVSAVRVNDAGERRYLQITNSVNPGNSGGPLLDRDGFAVGVISMRLTRAPDIAFAIPINDVKNFLESHGLDQAMQSRRLRLGPLHDFDAKGIALRLPETFVDSCSTERIAFNESVLRESLSSLQAQRFGMDDAIAPEKLEWSTPGARNIVPFPAGWQLEPGRPSPCAGLPQPPNFIAAVPPHDLTLALRAAVWTAGEITPEVAASACSSRRGSVDGASYASRGSWLGTTYLVEGAFIRAGSRVIQLEVLATEQRAALARALLGVWVKKASDSPERQ